MTSVLGAKTRGKNPETLQVKESYDVGFVQNAVAKICGILCSVRFKQWLSVWYNKCQSIY